MSEKIQFRVADEFRARLREGAKNAGMSESSYVRYLLETVLGDDDELAAVNQVVWTIQARLQRRIAAVGAALRVELERILLEPGEDE